MTANGLEAIHLSKTYTIDSRQITVLDNVDLKVRQGEFVVIEGKSGSGKSTLLSLLSGLDRPDTGQILLGGTDITSLTEDELAPFRNRAIGFVFQSFHLVPSLTAYENIMFPAELSHDKNAPAKARKLMEKVELGHRMNNFPHQLSGGEKQRVAICRALINNPQIIFADEPTGNLDSVNGETILHLLLKLRQDMNSTLILATHSKEISKLADQVVLLSDGKIVHSGSGKIT